MLETKKPISMYLFRGRIPWTTISNALLLIFLFGGWSLELAGQINETELLSDSLIREGYQNLGRAGFEKTSANGFYIQDQRKPQFRLTFGAWSTPRYNSILRNNASDTIPGNVTEWNVNRTRIYLKGIYSDKFNFTLVTNIGPDGGFTLQQAYLTYNINNKYIVSIGKQFQPSSREDWMDPADILSMQCSANDATFALGTSFSALLYARPRNQMRWWVSISNALYGWNREVTGSDQSDFMIGARYEYALRGEDWTVWDDLVGRRGRSKGILFGISGNYMRQSVELLRDRGAQLNLDLSVNGDGYQVLVAGAWTGQFPEGFRNFSQWGLYAQGGYFFHELIQVYGRYDLVIPGNQPGNPDIYSAPGIGLNVYPFSYTNRWRVTMEYNHLFSIMDQTIVPLDLSLGFVESDFFSQQSFRVQVQFGF